MSNARDLELVAKVQAGQADDSAFSQLYTIHFRRVYAICLRMTSSPDTAEDLTQEVFLQVYRKMETFKGNSAFTTWLHRVTVNKVLMYFRSQKAIWEDPCDPIDLLKYEKPNERKIYFETQTDSIAIQRAIPQMPIGYQKALILHDVEGYEHNEIGKILGHTAGTSKSQLHRARNRMKKLLTAKNPNPIL